MAEQRCGNCVHYCAPVNSKGARYFPKGSVYPCSYPAVDLTNLLPDSDLRVRKTTGQRYMAHTDGTKCPVWGKGLK